LLYVLFYVLFVCKCVLPPGDNPIAVNKYIISYQVVTSPSTAHSSTLKMDTAGSSKLCCLSTVS